MKYLFSITIILIFFTNSVSQNSGTVNPIQFTDFTEKINLETNISYKCKLKFSESDETISTWSWKLFLNNPDSIYTLLSEDSIESQNESTFSIFLDTIPYPSFSYTYISFELIQQKYNGIIFVYGRDSKNNKFCLGKEVTIAGEIIQYYGYGCCSEDFIAITSGKDSVHENGTFSYSAHFFDDDESGNYSEFWNWKSYYITQDGCSIIAKNDSIYGYNTCDWTMKIENLNNDNYIAKDGLNYILGYVGVNTKDSDNTYFFETKNIFISNLETGIVINKKLPDIFHLYQNYPNPFNPSTKIKYFIKKPDIVSLKVFDLTGKELATIVNKFHNVGEYETLWYPDNLSSGLYIYRLQTGQYSESKKLVILK